MKLYTDHTGKFQMFIPVNWEFKNPSLYHIPEDGKPQAFGLYDGFLGAFQISCKPITKHIEALIKTRKETIQSSDSKCLKFTEQKIKSGKQDLFAFSCAVDDHYFFATYIIPANSDKIAKYISELSDVRKTLATIKFVKPKFRKEVIAGRRFDLFMTAIASTIDLKNKAAKTGSFIEYVVLSSNHLDALLRLSKILLTQIKNKSKEIDVTILFQSEKDKIVMERKIFQIVFEEKIVSEEIYNELEDLYKERNKVVHRYIITDIRSDDILDIAHRYDELEKKVSRIVNKLEQEQSELGVGIYGERKDLSKEFSENDMRELYTKIRDKQGNVTWNIVENDRKNK